MYTFCHVYIFRNSFNFCHGTTPSNSKLVKIRHCTVTRFPPICVLKRISLFARGQSLRIIICKRPVPLDHHLQDAGPLFWQPQNGHDKCVFETLHNEIKCVLRVKESNFNEKKDQNSHIVIWLKLYGICMQIYKYMIIYVNVSDQTAIFTRETKMLISVCCTKYDENRCLNTILLKRETLEP